MTIAAVSEALFESIHALLPQLAADEARDEAGDGFVAGNLEHVAATRFLAALIPTELGGEGASHAAVCDALRRIAHGAPSTALVLAMHHHLVAAAVWRWRRDQSTAPMLTKVAAGPLRLVSTGANDWLESNGTLTAVDGGYLLTATKIFASGSIGGNLVVTSARLEKPGAAEVLHFAVPLSASGVTVRADWMAMGMRGTGSNTIVFDGVFVPESAVTLRRTAGEFHVIWSVVLTVALPLIMSVYLGIAERAAEIARELVRPDEAAFTNLGMMFDALTSTRLAVARMVALCDDLNFAPAIETTNEVIACKTIAAREAVRTVDLAVAAVGGRAYYRSTGLERLARDVRAAAFHPVQELKQARMSGRILMGLDPVA